jgi:hypothetical protein
MHGLGGFTAAPNLSQNGLRYASAGEAANQGTSQKRFVPRLSKSTALDKKQPSTFRAPGELQLLFSQNSGEQSEAPAANARPARPMAGLTTPLSMAQ